MSSATPDLWLPSHLQDITACDWYQIILLGDRGTRVWTTCPRWLPCSGTTGSRTRHLSSRKPTPNHYIIPVFRTIMFIFTELLVVKHRKTTVEGAQRVYISAKIGLGMEMGWGGRWVAWGRWLMRCGRDTLLKTGLSAHRHIYRQTDRQTDRQSENSIHAASFTPFTWRIL